jgi:hypothetical protein
MSVVEPKGLPIEPIELPDQLCQRLDVPLGNKLKLLVVLSLQVQLNLQIPNLLGWLVNYLKCIKRRKKIELLW